MKQTSPASSEGTRAAGVRVVLSACVIAAIEAAASSIAGAALADDASRAASLEGGQRGDAAHGKALYQACSACHSVDENDIGPKHRGVVGRAAGSIADYAYSPALKQSGLIWDEATLNRWLVNPSVLVPGTKMFFKIDDAQSRADIIAYLKEQK
jgi:cytochrome c